MSLTVFGSQNSDRAIVSLRISPAPKIMTQNDTGTHIFRHCTKHTFVCVPCELKKGGARGARERFIAGEIGGGWIYFLKARNSCEVPPIR